MMTANNAVLKLFASIILVAALPGTAWSGQSGDAAFQSAREAYVKGDKARLETALANLGNHPLAPWAEFFRLDLRLRGDDNTGVTAFIEQNEGSYLAEKMRGSWIAQLAKQENWPLLRQQFALMRRPDADTTCRGLDARLRLGEAEATTDAVMLLAADAPLAQPCLVPLARLAAAGTLSADDIRLRMRRQFAQGTQGKLKEARILAGWLPGKEIPDWKAVELIIDQPARHLSKLPGDFAKRRADRELALLATLRMAKADLRVAATRWSDIEASFDKTDRGFVWGQLALRAALGHQPEAVDWYAKATGFNAPLDEEQQAWRVRAALRTEDWRGVASAIDALPANMSAQPEWIYWRGRAHAAVGEKDKAQAAYARISGQPNFYGILAGEILGKPYTVPKKATAPTDTEIAAVQKMPGLVRGIALIQGGMRLEGIREWNWTLTGMKDRELLAAAEVARRNEVIDRAINTADRTQDEHDFSQRYPTPFLAEVEPKVREVSLDTAWVYGLMRQESRFIMDAKSSAGAKGLMQLMPATARWVAKKIGMKDYHPGRVVDMDVNVTLGTNYMKMVLDSLDDHPVLASAGYNAGPGRARKWRGDRPLEGAIYAETIPFNETRDYVKKVMSNAVHYAALLGGSTPTLTQRLGTIQPRGFRDSKADDLP